MNFPENIRYTEDHEWIRIEEGNIAYIGITDFAQSELGELVYIEVETIEEDVAAGDVFGTVEAVKTTSDLLMPVAGKIIAFNPKIDEAEGDDPTLVNSDPYGEGWIVKVELENLADVENLLTVEAYKEIVG